MMPKEIIAEALAKHKPPKHMLLLKVTKQTEEGLPIHQRARCLCGWQADRSRYSDTWCQYDYDQHMKIVR